MYVLLDGRLKADDWDAEGLSPNKVAKDIVQEFKDKLPNFIESENSTDRILIIT